MRSTTRSFHGQIYTIRSLPLRTIFNGFAGDSALDHNGHVNNVKYCDFILDAISLKNEKVMSFEINYLNELPLGKYNVLHVKVGDNRLIKGLSGENESFRAVIKTF